MAEALGSIRIDLLASMVEFTNNVKNALYTLEDFGKKGNRIVNDLDRTFQQLGSKLTLKVTAPLVALGIAAIKAADPAKKMSQEMERAGLRMQKALAPVGEVLIKQLERLKPTLNAAIDTVNGLALRFAALSPETQRNIVLIASMTAAVGPALLALSALTSSLKAAAMAMGGLWKAGSSLLVLLPHITVAAVALATAFEMFNVGGWMYDAFKPLQQAMATAIHGFTNLWLDFKFGAQSAFLSIEVGFKKLMAALVPGPAVTGFLATLMQVSNPAAAQALRTVGGMGAVPAVPDLGKEMDKLATGYAMSKALNTETLARQLQDIEVSFGGRNFKPEAESPMKRMGDQVDALIDKIVGLNSKLRQSLKSAMDFGAGASTAIVQTSKEAEEAKQKSKELTDQLKRDMEKAKDLRFAVYPREKLAEDIKNLNQMAVRFPQILSPDVVKGTVDKWIEELRRLENKINETFATKIEDAIRNFSSNVSDTFADLVVDGKAAFEDLLKSFEKMLVSMVAKQFIFEPLLGALGRGVGSLIGGGTTPAAGAGAGAAYPPDSANYGALSSSPLGRGWQGGGVVVNVIDQSGGVQVKQGKGADGSTLIDILVPGMQAAFASTKLDRAMRDNYGISRKARY